MTTPTPRALALIALALPLGCTSSSTGGGPTSTTTSASTSTTGAGGASQGGASQGGSSQGGAAQGGSSQGGASQGGASHGGSSQGGASQGGSAQGGAGGAPPACDQPATFGEVKTKALSGCSGFGPMSCHNKAPFGGDLDLSGDMWSALVNVPASGAAGKLRVKPGDAEASFLYQKLTNTMAQDGTEGDPMPKGEAIQWQPPAPDVEAAVRCWIEGGAKND